MRFTSSNGNTCKSQFFFVPTRRFVFPDELFWLLSQQRQVVFTCQPCRQIRCMDSSLKEELQSKLITGLEEVLVGLLSSKTTQHLLACKEVRTLHVAPQALA